MTILVAITEPGAGRTWLGSDTICVEGYKPQHVGQKWAVHDGCAIGVSGEVRAMQIVHECVDELFEDCCSPTELANDLAGLFSRYDFKFDHGREAAGSPGCPITCLYATPRGIWEIGNYFEVYEVPVGHLAAVGSGAPYAIGCSLGLEHGQAASGLRADPAEALRLCMGAAVKQDLSCGGSLWIDHIKEAKADEPNTERPDDVEAGPETVNALGQEGQAETQKGAG